MSCVVVLEESRRPYGSSRADFQVFFFVLESNVLLLFVVLALFLCRLQVLILVQVVLVLITEVLDNNTVLSVFERRLTIIV